ncbi:unnamed protein product [Brassica oleracea var. botrytis]|uniref:BnaC03g71070D protein n=4 Tax=Brassica TaxID=3705 RepID=A0A078FBZ7_BRANA|nr:BnaC03g71070D [Brassica napus]VDD01649.1 unnamed protein product [Brassica oleracea]
MCIKKKKRIHNDHLDGSSHPYFPCFGSVWSLRGHPIKYNI